jgi:hypothetical protein
VRTPGGRHRVFGLARTTPRTSTATLDEVDLSEEDLDKIDAILMNAARVWGPHPEGI